MTTTETKPVTITRFTQSLADPAERGCRAYLIPWSEVQPGDLVLIEDGMVLIEDGMVLAEDVQVFLCEWGDGTMFIRVDVSTRHDSGFLGCGEHKGDTLTCVRRAHDDIPEPLTEAWAAWMLDAGVPEDGRCRCRASRFSPHPCTPDHGHPDDSEPPEQPQRSSAP